MTPLQVAFPAPGEVRFAARLQALLDTDVALHLGAGALRDEITVLVAGVPEAEHLDALPRLRAVVIPWAGVHPTWRAHLASRPDVRLYNLHHNAAATAEMAVALLLAVWKRIVPSDAALRRGDWTARHEGPPSQRVAGRRVVVVGHGAIGRRVARALRGLEAEVVGVRRSAGDTGGTDERVVGVGDLDGLLPTADAVVLAAPATPETEHLLDARRLALLPSHAVLVNVARGRLVHEAALHEALAAGRLAGAGLDVWWRYPRTRPERQATPPSAFPFGDLPQVVLSPHRAAHTHDDDEDRARALAALLQALARGDAPRAVDIELGY
jgi:phosphoglycerate dehydrogenase-like enzyme